VMINSWGVEDSEWFRMSGRRWRTIDIED